MLKKNLIEFEEVKKINEPCSLIIGNFDGVHLGHQHLLNSFIEYSKNNGLKTILITFEPHPLVFLKKANTRFLIDNYCAKITKIRSFDIDFISTLKFNDSLQSLSAEKFIDNYLMCIPGLEMIQLGHDFKLGKGKVDSKAYLLKQAKKARIDIRVEESFFLEKEIVSSSNIRKTIVLDICKANSQLGKEFSINGKIVKGKGIGTSELVPTANILTGITQIIPGSGVYATKIRIGEEIFESVTNIGINPTVGNENDQTIETHIFHLNQNIYNESIELIFFEKLRDEKKFPSFEKLKQQINYDILETKKIFRRRSTIKLALIGKNIAHSQSQAMYEDLFKKCVNYTLIDCESSSNIPTLGELQQKYDGVSITSPYKEHFLSTTLVQPKDLIGVNALAFRDGSVHSTNTDYYAIKEILQSENLKNITEYFILGDGVMSRFTQMILDELGQKYKILSRKNNLIGKVDEVLTNKNEKTLVINTCSREYCFSKSCSGRFHFWDMNYKLEHHVRLFENSSIKYFDGMDQLNIQAKYAISFWNLKTF